MKNHSKLMCIIISLSIAVSGFCHGPTAYRTAEKDNTYKINVNQEVPYITMAEVINLKCAFEITCYEQMVTQTLIVTDKVVTTNVKVSKNECVSLSNPALM